MRFQLALNKTFCPNPQPLTHRQVKQCQRTKINKTILSAPLSPTHRLSTQSLQYQNWNKYSILTVNEPGPPVLESSARISKFYAPTDSEHKFNKTEIENWPPIGYNLWSFWLGTHSHNCYTMFIHQWEEPSGFICLSIKSWNNPGNISLPRSCASVVKSHKHHPE